MHEGDGCGAIAFFLFTIHNSQFTIYDLSMAGPTETLTPHRGFYPSTVSEKQRKDALAQVLAERKAQHDAEEAERKRLYATRHAARMQDFRNQISRDDRFTDEEKTNIINASYEW